MILDQQKYSQDSPEEEIKIFSAPPKNTESVENVLEMLQEEVNIFS